MGNYLATKKGLPQLLKILFFAIFLGESASLAQSADDSDSSAEDDIKTVLDSSPFLSARAAGMGGALSTLADGIHAPFYNPAGIGGIHWGKENPPVIRQLHFPYVAAGANEETTRIRKEFSDMGGGTEKSVGKAIIDANAGKRQYGRASALVSIVAKRFMLLQYDDAQMAAFRREGVTDESVAME